MIPHRIKTSIDSYVDNGHDVGHFLGAVLRNDLFEAVFRADEENLWRLHDICRYIFNFAPSSCWGSMEKVETWKKLHRVNPAQAERIALADRDKRKDYEL